MQAAEDELDIQGEASSVPWWEAAPFHGASHGPAHSSSHGLSSFASVLSAVAEHETQRENSAPAWSEVDAGEDAASLSYEGALRARAEIAWKPASPIEGKHKSASVTVRLSEEENAQLRERAAEAGLTISAYLRSCTLEAETLRAQVKQALTALRAASLEEQRFPHDPEAQAPRRWWRLRPHSKSWSAQA
jgi:hypothetical protein